MAKCIKRPRAVGAASRPPSLDPALGQILVQNQCEWFAIHSGVPGAEVHQDPDLVWKITNGSVWSNAGIRPRFEPTTVETRLDRVIKRFAEHGRGAGFWVDFDATPADLELHLRRRGFHCRRHFPGLACNLSALPDVAVPEGLKIQPERDYSAYSIHPHPVWGPINTPIRRYELNRVKRICSVHPDSVSEFVAFTNDARPVGSCILFLTDFNAAIFAVGVLDEERGKGIGSALLAHVLRFARERGRQHAFLLASSMGVSMYERVGFREVCRVGYWYRASFAA